MNESVLAHQEKIEWMAMYAVRNNVRLALDGEVGFMRSCVGIICSNESYPDYSWDNPDTYERMDENGDVWTPEDAYHKHPCVAVLGTGENAEAQLYEWLKWFDDNGFKVEVVEDRLVTKNTVGALMGNYRHARMTRQVTR